eukprot:TRINITY_DN5236_c0_g1_i2.p1 TRINITY_DN5236_c0_g1~~TRINITY_DN5236_c0_g1_i2.p1  ORF type:complete len:874 (+),score=298.14 TRINITY_DN5236_c0_g1_i2:32-2623(+)
MEVEEGSDSDQPRDGFSYKDQFTALFAKTAILQMRDRKTNLCQILTPFVFMGVLVFFNWMINSVSTPVPVAENLIPEYSPQFSVLQHPDAISQEDFYQNGIVLQDIAKQGSELVYTGSLDLNELFNLNLSSNVPTTSQTKFLTSQIVDYPEAIFSLPSIPLTLDTRHFDTLDDMYSYIFSSHNSLPHIAGGYVLDQVDLFKQKLRFGVIYNNTLTEGVDVPFMLNRMTDALCQNLDEPFSVKLTSVKLFPTRASPGQDIDIVSIGSTITIVLLLQSLFPVFLTSIVSEKENRIKELMKMTGLYMPLYWLVHYVFDYIVYIIIMSCLIISGCVFQVRFFLENNFWVYFVLFLMWGHVIVMAAFLSSLVFSNKKSALVVGYVVIIVVGLTCFVLVNSLIGSDLEHVDNSLRFGLSIFPPFALYRALIYLAAEVQAGGFGYPWDLVTDPALHISEVYQFFIVQWIVMFLLWVYLEQVFPSTYGVPKHPLFFLGMGRRKNYRDEAGVPEGAGKDVQDEFERAFSDVSEYAIKCQNLSHVFPAGDGKGPNTAVDRVSFVLEKNSCLGILGHNGAGKTTLISLLIGLIPTSQGTAKILGNDLGNDLPKIHTIMGVCQQYDILWETLTGEEHLIFFGRIRGLKSFKLKKSVEEALKKVNLYNFRKVQAGRYSGGMKRRLSVAIAILGKPPIIYLDEPSTGLDPKSRQDLWQVINDVKKDCSLLMTTHSMEEAEVISNKLMVLIDGGIKAVAPSAELKSRYGDGLNLSIQVAKGRNAEAAHSFIMSLAPEAILLNELSGTRNYKIPKGSLTLDVMFEEMESMKSELGITDWAVTNTTLEEVFLKISEMHHNVVQVLTHSKKKSKSEVVDLP